MIERKKNEWWHIITYAWINHVQWIGIRENCIGREVLLKASILIFQCHSSWALPWLLWILISVYQIDGFLGGSHEYIKPYLRLCVLMSLG